MESILALHTFLNFRRLKMRQEESSISKRIIMTIDVSISDRKLLIQVEYPIFV